MIIELDLEYLGRTIALTFLQISTSIANTSTKLITMKEVYSTAKGIESLIVKGEAVSALDSNYLVIYLKKINTKKMYHRIEVEFEQITCSGDTVMSSLHTVTEYGRKAESKILNFLNTFTSNLIHTGEE